MLFINPPSPRGQPICSPRAFVSNYPPDDLNFVSETCSPANKVVPVLEGLQTQSLTFPAPGCRSMERSLTDEEINDLQERVRQTMVDKLGAELR